jgi:hypothetical protein
MQLKQPLHDEERLITITNIGQRLEPFQSSRRSHALGIHILWQKIQALSAGTAQTLEVGDGTDRLPSLAVNCAKESPLDFVAQPVAKLDGVEFIRAETAHGSPPQQVASSMAMYSILADGFWM